MTRGLPASIYVMCSARTGFVKIGRSSNAERRRLELDPSGLDLTICFVTEPRNDAYFLEPDVHKLLADRRQYGEMFNVTVDEAIDAITAAIRQADRSKVQLHETMKCFRCKPQQIFAPYAGFDGWRSYLGITPQQAADKLGVSLRTVERWEAGTAMPSDMVRMVMTMLAHGVELKPWSPGD